MYSTLVHCLQLWILFTYVTWLSRYTYQFGHTVYHCSHVVLTFSDIQSYKLVTYILSKRIRIKFVCICINEYDKMTWHNDMTQWQWQIVMTWWHAWYTEWIRVQMDNSSRNKKLKIVEENIYTNEEMRRWTNGNAKNINAESWGSTGPVK